MNNTKIIGMDVDDVVLKLIDSWLREYNFDWEDNLTVENITEWDMSKFVKPACGYRIYDYLSSPSIYNDVAFVDGAITGVASLRTLGYRVVFITAGTIGQSGVKARILQNAGLLPSMKDYVEAVDKSIVTVDYLVDDNPENILATRAKGIVFDAPYNRALDGYYRVKTWHDLLRYFVNEKNKELYSG